MPARAILALAAIFCTFMPPPARAAAEPPLCGFTVGSLPGGSSRYGSI